MDTLRQDLLYALRSLRRRPGFTLVVVITLAVAIGPLTAIFSVVDAVLLKPLPFAESDRVVQIWSGRGAAPHGPTSSANFVDWRSLNRSFEAIAAEDFDWYNLIGDDDERRPERLHGAVVSPSFFRAVGVKPAIGRALVEEEEQPGARVVVLGDALWRRRFGGDARIVGRRINLNGEDWTVAGVMPAGFDFPGPLIGMPVDLWTPLAWKPNDLERGIRRLGVTARLKPGVTLAQARRDMEGVTARLAERFPKENAGVVARLVPVHEELIGGNRRALLVLLGAVALVLLIACANVANLMLARAQGRQREMALRAALGAGRRRIARQLLTESLLLAAAAATLGTLGAVWLTDLFVALSPTALPRATAIGVDGRVLLFVLVVATLTGLAFGAAPLLQLAPRQLGDSLREGAARSLTMGRGRRRAGSAMVVLEIATALMLLVGAGLLIRSLQHLLHVDPGFDSSRVLAARVALPANRYEAPERQRQFVDDGLARISVLPGVAHAAAIDYLPFGQSDASLTMTVEGRVVASPQEVSAHFRSITGDYPAVMHIPLLRGRTFAVSDRKGTPLVAIVNDAMARRYWPAGDAIGHRVRIGGPDMESPWLTVVGVIGNVKHWSLSETPEPELYVPLAQSPALRFNFVVRAAVEPTALVSSIRDALLAVDREQPVTIEPMRGLVLASVSAPRFRGLLLGGFAAIAMTLAVVGIYGLISFGVSQRTRELGIRVALGAQRTAIVSMVLREGMRLTAAGVAIGLAGALATTRVLEGMLYEVPSTDPATFVGVSLLLVVTAAIANYLPARRAAKVDPAIALQAE